jgi:hypothetical protein
VLCHVVWLHQTGCSPALEMLQSAVATALPHMSNFERNSLKKVSHRTAPPAEPRTGI